MEISVFLVYYIRALYAYVYVLCIRNCVSLNKYRIRSRKKTSLKCSVGRVKMIKKKFWHKEAFHYFLTQDVGISNSRENN